MPNSRKASKLQRNCETWIPNAFDRKDVLLAMDVPNIADMVGSSVDAVEEMIRTKNLQPLCQWNGWLLYGPEAIVRIDKLTLRAKAKGAQAND